MNGENFSGVNWMMGFGFLGGMAVSPGELDDVVVILDGSKMDP